MTIPTKRGHSAVLFTAAFFLSGAAQADAVSDFYKGRSVEIVVGAGAGGGYDANGRLIARHLGRFIPGNPNVVVTNMPGGGGITATNVLYNVSSKEGLVLGTFSNSMLTEPLLGTEAIKFDPSKFSWIGSVSREDGVCVTSAASGVKTWADVLSKEVLAGTTAPGTTTYLYPTLLNRMFGAKFKLITGYPDGSSIILALDRGEISAVCQTYSSLNIAHPDWLPQKKVFAVVSMGLGRNPELADIPSIIEIARTDGERQMLKIVLAPTVAGRPLTAPPNVPAERIAALRAAFDAMVKDEGFLADAKKSRIEVQPTSGPEIDKLVQEIFATPKDVIQQVRAMASPAGK